MATRRESMDERKKRAWAILRELTKLYPECTCALHHDSALKLLLATILSAQSTDEMVNRITPTLFSQYPTAASLAEAPTAEIERVIKPTGFFRQKTKSIQGACRKIVDEHGGEVPDTMEALTSLPGVARKTANVVLGTWFNKNLGVVVDTHVGRLAQRMGLTWTGRDAKDAVRIEQDLMQLVPQKQWTHFAHAMVWHGRRICTARKPDCAACTLAKLCPSAFTFETATSKAPKRAIASAKQKATPRKG
ncbi:MAG: endonuclease III [Phycisphaerae bacterium]|nr:endonuclease III [Phycisphaerae bacterium]